MMDWAKPYWQIMLFLIKRVSYNFVRFVNEASSIHFVEYTMATKINHWQLEAFGRIMPTASILHKKGQPTVWWSRRLADFINILPEMESTYILETVVLHCQLVIPILRCFWLTWMSSYRVYIALHGFHTLSHLPKHIDRTLIIHHHEIFFTRHRYLNGKLTFSMFVYPLIGRFGIDCHRTNCSFIH